MWIPRSAVVDVDPYVTKHRRARALGLATGKPVYRAPTLRTVAIWRRGAAGSEKTHTVLAEQFDHVIPVARATVMESIKEGRGAATHDEQISGDR